MRGISKLRSEQGQSIVGAVLLIASGTVFALSPWVASVLMFMGAALLFLPVSEQISNEWLLALGLVPLPFVAMAIAFAVEHSGESYLIGQFTLVQCIDATLVWLFNSSPEEASEPAGRHSTAKLALSSSAATLLYAIVGISLV